MSTTLAIGNYLTFVANNSVRFRFQNFFINRNATFAGASYQFLPFGFSGITINRQGDNTDASLVFPNNELSRPFAAQALEERWLATVAVVSLNSDNAGAGTQLYSYTGQCATGSWDEASLNIRLNTVLDAVGADVPQRRLTQSLVGALPITSNVRLQ
jgi:hypothetical protein